VTETMPPAHTPRSAGAMAGALRRSPAESQRDYTVLLDVLARPGKRGVLRVPDGVPPAALAAAGLVDVEVPLCVLADPAQEGGWDAAVHAASNAPRSELEFARAVLALRAVTPAEVACLPRGDALNPERGARLFASVAGLTDGSAGVRLRLAGPGIPGERTLGVQGLPAAVFTALAAANSAFPLGIDTFLVAADGTVAGLPRTTRVHLEEAGE
jgi:alpha-D-ribose 1-methylphosphonate 5-triphosphate synthase subunit PhnH